MRCMVKQLAILQSWSKRLFLAHKQGFETKCEKQGDVKNESNKRNKPT